LIIDPEKKLGSIIANEINLREITAFFASLADTGAILVDVGAGARPYEPLYRDKLRRCISFDVDYSPHATGNWTFKARAEYIPLKSGLCDVVLCTEVLEHTRDPRKTVKEMSRICKIGGNVLLSTPFLIGIHEAPHDYFRFTEFGLRELFSKNGLGIVRIRRRGEILGVMISLLVTVQLKFWHLIATAVRTRTFTSLINPFVFLFVYLPQKIYLLFEDKMVSSHHPIPRTWLEKFSHYNLGYVVVAKKESVPKFE